VIRALLLCGAAPLALASAALAGDRDFCADRPGKDTPPCVLDQGRWQVEVSFADGVFQRQRGVATDAWTFGDFEIRYGLTPALEAEVAWSPYATVTSHDRATGARFHASGVGDLAFALRQNLRNPDGSGFSVAVEPFAVAPTGALGISADKWAGGVLIPIGVDLAHGTGLALTPEVDIVPDADGSGAHLAWSGVVGLSHAVGQVSLAADVWAAINDDPAGHTTFASFDISAAWQPEALKDVQFDVGVNVGLTAETPDVEVLAGVAKRF
jgi:hypothetical protein